MEHEAVKDPSARAVSLVELKVKAFDAITQVQNWTQEADALVARIREIEAAGAKAVDESAGIAAS